MAKIALFLNSGGLDSLITAKTMQSQGWDLHSVYIDLGQRNVDVTKVSSKAIADKYCVSHQEIKIGDQSFAKEFVFNGKVFLGLPMQAQIIHTVGGFLARFSDIDYVVSGQKDDAVTENFHSILTDLFSTDKLQQGIIFLRPVSKIIRIQDVVNKGLELGLDMEEMKQTHSCNSNPPCGQCKKCLERKECGLDE